MYPPDCPLCGSLLPQSSIAAGEKICKICRGEISYVESPWCLKCGKEICDVEKEYCEDCENNIRSYIAGFPAINYAGAIRNSIAQFKYHGKKYYGAYYAEEILKCHGDRLRELEPDAFIPVPIHRKRYNKRGYNQAEVLARELGAALQIPVDSGVLLRGVNTSPQKNLDDRERENNLKSAFQYSGKIVKYNRVVLVDDIYTTGATIEACTTTLHDIGIRDVYYTSICIGKGY
ncbi:MAG: ComF family protein [Wujia sp.]